jgi:hypothetical protein
VVDKQMVPVKAGLSPGDVVGVQEDSALAYVVRGSMQGAGGGALPSGAAPVDGEDDWAARRTHPQQCRDDIGRRHRLPRPEVRLLREQPQLLSALFCMPESSRVSQSEYVSLAAPIVRLARARLTASKAVFGTAQPSCLAIWR